MITDWPTFWRPPQAIFKLEDPGRTRTGASLKALAERTMINIARTFRLNILAVITDAGLLCERPFL